MSFPARPAERTWPPLPARWALGCDVDFTALPTSGTWSDGSVRIGGVDWTASSSGNADTFGLTEGVGIEIASKSGTAFSSSSQSAPRLEAKLSDLIGSFDRQDRLFVQVAVASAGLSSDGQAYGLQVGSGTASADASVAMYELVYAGGLLERTSRYRPGGTVQSTDTSIASEPDFLALDYRIFVAASRRAAASDVPSGRSWPRPRDMAVGHQATNIWAVGLGSAGDFDPDTDICRIWAERGSGGAFTATFERLRILVQRWGS